MSGDDEASDGMQTRRRALHVLLDTGLVRMASARGALRKSPSSWSDDGDLCLEALLKGPRVGRSPRARELHAELIRCLGVRAADAAGCLREKFGVHPDDEPTEAQLDQMEEAFAEGLQAPWWWVEEPRWLQLHSWRSRGDLLIWLQRLRREVGQELEVFAPKAGRGGDPSWTRVSRWFGAQLGEKLDEAGVPRNCHQLLKAQARRMICERYDLQSTRHLPPSICQREVIDLLLRCELQGIRNVLDLSYVDEVTRRHGEGFDEGR